MLRASLTGVEPEKNGTGTVRRPMIGRPMYMTAPVGIAVPVNSM